MGTMHVTLNRLVELVSTAPVHSPAVAPARSMVDLPAGDVAGSGDFEDENTQYTF